MQLEIVHPGRYTAPETFVQTTLFVHVGLCLGGLDYMNIAPPGGGEQLKLTGAAAPFLTMIPPGAHVDFRFGRKRENWVIQCRMPELIPVAGACRQQLEQDGSLLCFPYMRRIKAGHALPLRERFALVVSLWQSGTPANRIAAEWMTVGICGEMFAEEEPPDQEGTTPAARLRLAIDADRGFRKTLAELSREAGASAGFLRKCFRRAYQLEPAEYRARRRLSRIMELIDRNELSLKEIAEEVGMRHVTHLHAFVRERCGVTPGELQKQRGRIS